MFSSNDVEEISKLFNSYCTYVAMFLKSLNFMFRFKNIIALRKTLNDIIESCHLDGNDPRFLHYIKRGLTCYKAELFAAWIA